MTAEHDVYSHLAIFRFHTTTVGVAVNVTEPRILIQYTFRTK